MIPEEKLRSKTSKICVVGLGYVGLPLAIHIAQKGFRVTGLDSDAEKLTMLRAGMSYIEDVPNHLVSSLIDTGELQVTDSYGIISEMDVLIICVPSPIDHQKSPDLSYVTSCCKSLLPNLRESQLIILESTVYPGATEEIILPLLSEGTLVPEEHFWIAYSPERIDPGNKQYTIENVPKLVSGISKMGSHLAKTFYDQLLKAEVIEVVTQHFRPEFTNRIDDLVVFHPLESEHIRKIVDIQLQYLHQRLGEQDLELVLSDEAGDRLAEAGYDPVYGARPLKRAIQQQLCLLYTSDAADE